jgi:hypothetical protein
VFVRAGQAVDLDGEVNLAVAIGFHLDRPVDHARLAVVFAATEGARSVIKECSQQQIVKHQYRGSHVNHKRVARIWRR